MYISYVPSDLIPTLDSQVLGISIFYPLNNLLLPKQTIARNEKFTTPVEHYIERYEAHYNRNQQPWTPRQQKPSAPVLYNDRNFTWTCSKTEEITRRIDKEFRYIIETLTFWTQYWHQKVYNITSLSFYQHSRVVSPSSPPSRGPRLVSCELQRPEGQVGLLQTTLDPYYESRQWRSKDLEDLDTWRKLTVVFEYWIPIETYSRIWILGPY